MKMMEIPTLKAEDIEVKVKQVGKKGAVALLYKTARTDMEYLDKVFGIGNWQCDYKEIKGNLYCTIDIWDDEKNTWVHKVDCGIESREDGDGNEKKGEASDAFKRAGFKVGIGRELYSAPFTFLSVATEPDGKDNRGRDKYRLADPFQKFSVSEIGYDSNRKINRLIIVDSNGNIVYRYGASGGTTPDKPKGRAKKPESNADVSVGNTVPPTTQEVTVEQAEGLFNSFLKAHNLDGVGFTAWRDKASRDPSTGVVSKKFNTLTPDEWVTLLAQLEALAQGGYFNE